MCSRLIASLLADRGSSRLSLSMLLVAATLGGAWSSAPAQDSNGRVVSGYITAVGSADSFDVNGQHIFTQATTAYGLIDGKASDAHTAANGSPLKDALRVGAYVRVAGAAGEEKKTVKASLVLLRNDWDKKLSGFGVVERILGDGSEPVFVADGYRIQIPANAEVSVGGNLKTLADVAPNTWVSYKGKRNGQGVLIASSAKFVPARAPAPKWLMPRPKTDPVQWVVPAGGALIDDNGNMKGSHEKVRLNDEGGRWHRAIGDDVLQARILRIGQALIPAYQKQLPEGDPAKITFRFYAADESKVRADIFCSAGLTLIPAQVVDRLENDDQIAAVLSDGIAYQIQLQSARYVAQNREVWGAAIVAALAVPSSAAPLGAYGVAAIVDHERNIRMEEQRGRMALGLMADAGYDPRQAPEAWRRLWQKNLPKDTDPLKYPDRSGYQLGILNLQYSASRANQPAPNSQASAGGSR